jgi:hypothetical protein
VYQDGDVHYTLRGRYGRMALRGENRANSIELFMFMSTLCHIREWWGGVALMRP